MADAASDHQAYEKLGAFYLGRVVGDAGAVTAQPLLYDSRDLVTHGVCIGMTGSGKTGLCLAAIEEAAIDGVPVLAIDPKGDLPNLLLAFPELRGKDFAAWADPDAARRAGLDLAAFGAREAERWRAGLAEWDQDPARIRRLREAAEFAVYTPGSTAGIPLSVLASFAAPPPAVRGDDELLAERATAVAAALLALVGVDADPLAGREPILLALILSAAWREGRDLDLAALIGLLQRPPLARVGVVELEAFMPAGERFALAMRLNNLLASPSFAAWSRGEPIDLDRLLRAPDGRPRVAIVSIAHLGERERMFVVALLLQQVLAWTRAQAGTTSLRAPALRRRDRRLPAAGRRAAVEGAAADPAQAGARVRRRLPARDPEPGRPRLQGAGQLRHLVHRPAADRARSDARPRRAGGGGRRRSGGARAPDRRPGPAAVRATRRPRRPTGGVRLALGAVLAARADDPRGDPPPDGRARRRGGGDRAGRRGGDRADPAAGDRAALAAGADAASRRGRAALPAAAGGLRLHRLARRRRAGRRAGGAARRSRWRRRLDRRRTDRAAAGGRRGRSRGRRRGVGSGAERGDRRLAADRRRGGRRRAPRLGAGAVGIAVARPALASRGGRDRVPLPRRAGRTRAPRRRGRGAAPRLRRQARRRRGARPPARGCARSRGRPGGPGEAAGLDRDRQRRARRAARAQGVSAANLGRAASAARGAGRAWQQGQDVARAEAELARVRDELDDLRRRAEGDVAAIPDVDPARLDLAREEVRPAGGHVAVRLVALAWEPVWTAPVGATRLAP